MLQNINKHKTIRLAGKVTWDTLRVPVGEDVFELTVPRGAAVQQRDSVSIFVDADHTNRSGPKVRELTELGNWGSPTFSHSRVPKCVNSVLYCLERFKSISNYYFSFLVVPRWILLVFQGVLGIRPFSKVLRVPRHLAERTLEEELSVRLACGSSTVLFHVFLEVLQVDCSVEDLCGALRALARNVLCRQEGDEGGRQSGSLWGLSLLHSRIWRCRIFGIQN